MGGRGVGGRGSIWSRDQAPGGKKIQKFVFDFSIFFHGYPFLDVILVLENNFYSQKAIKRLKN
jgi:hypothetical protein